MNILIKTNNYSAEYVLDVIAFSQSAIFYKCYILCHFIFVHHEKSVVTDCLPFSFDRDGNSQGLFHYAFPWQPVQEHH